jgi:hypothetical protein
MWENPLSKPNYSRDSVLAVRLGHRFAAGYPSVKRFIQNLRGSPAPEARVVIETAPGEDYAECPVMVRGGGDLGVVEVLAHPPGSNRR